MKEFIVKIIVGIIAFTLTTVAVIGIIGALYRLIEGMIK